MAFQHLDALIGHFDKTLRAMTGATAGYRAIPSSGVSDTALTPEERQHSAGLMRVNHVGEVCAQALYDSQSRAAHGEQVSAQLQHAGREEEDHLAWTAQRLRELSSRPSLLNPLWYAGAYALGTVVARVGDAHSLGFVVETERQVEAHLSEHLKRLPQQDLRSRAIVEQMRQDEVEHGAAAQKLGAQELPLPARALMKVMAKVMTTTAYYI